MNLAYAEVSPTEIGAFHPDRAAGVEHSVAFQRLANEINRDIFGQADAAALKAAYFGLEHGANTEVARSAADATIKPQTDMLAGVVVDTFDEAANTAHSVLDKGMDRVMGFADALPATLAATIAAAGAVLAGSFKEEESEAKAGEIGYDLALDRDGDGLVTDQEKAMETELSGVADAFVKHEMHVDTMVADMTDGELVGLAGNDPALTIAAAQEFMQTKAEAVAHGVA